MKYEVRCCCDPNKLLGHFEDDGKLQPGVPMYVAYKNEDSSVGFSSEKIELKVLNRRVCGIPLGYWAIPSMERPIEWWEKLPGFTKAE